MESNLDVYYYWVDSKQTEAAVHLRPVRAGSEPLSVVSVWAVKV